MTLEETIPLMLSEDYKDRIKAEYWQVKIRHDNLCRYISKDWNRTANKKTPDRKLSEQALVMMNYMIVLKERMEEENIDS